MQIYGISRFFSIFSKFQRRRAASSAILQRVSLFAGSLRRNAANRPCRIRNA